MIKHTPGPWRQLRQYNRGTIYIEAPLRQGWIQEVAACGPTEDETQQIANARLIAAAPDLLAALTGLYALVNGECPSILNEDSGGFAHMDRQISAAIEKATGE